MRSPFPGMDPYIETPELWSDFHNNLASEIRAKLNESIQPNYFARLTSYVTYEVAEVSKIYGIRPDTDVWHLQTSPPETSAAVATARPAPVESRVALDIPLRLHSIEIKVTATDELVTVIEILSPVNKKPGHSAYRDYQRKRRDILRSSVHLLEIDLLRQGERPPLEEPVPEAPYYIMLSRVDHRPIVAVWPIQLTDTLITVPIPLLEPDPDVYLDLQVAVASVYERGAYARQIDYRQPPPGPPLADEDLVWLDNLLQAQDRR
jgi:hypothetical protein